jgi:mRNA interferase RelE/StbE
MTIVLSNRAANEIADAPPGVRKAAYKQLRLLASNLNHPSLHAKKYDEAKDIWQARVNRNWRFYFKIVSGVCLITNVIAHPK